jgi:hypothetical protein
LSRIKGSLARSTPDWYIFKVAATKLYQPAAGGQYSYVGLYNNATDGSLLYVVHAAMGGLTADTSFFGQFYGNLFTTTSQTHSLYPPTATPPGIVGSWTSATDLFNVPGLGTPAYCEVGSHNDTTWEWPADFPMAVIPPGYTAAFERRTIAVDLEASFWWVALK